MLQTYLLHSIVLMHAEKGNNLQENRTTCFNQHDSTKHIRIVSIINICHAMSGQQVNTGFNVHLQTTYGILQHRGIQMTRG